MPRHLLMSTFDPKRTHGRWGHGLWLQAFLAWTIVGVGLAWVALVVYPLDPLPWQISAGLLAIVGLLIHLVLLVRKSRRASVERVAPSGTTLMASVILAFVGIGAPVCMVTEMIWSPQFRPGIWWMPVQEVVATLLFLSYSYLWFPAALAGFVDAAAILVLWGKSGPIEWEPSLRFQAVLGAGSGIFSYAIFSALVWADAYVAEGLSTWFVPSALAGAVAGVAVNGVAFRHVRT